MSEQNHAYALLDVAETLLKPLDRTQPTDAALRRCISTSYYAAFTAVCTVIADAITSDRTCSAWQRAYRGLEHSAFEKAVSKLASGSDSEKLMKRVLEAIIALKNERHLADYAASYQPTLPRTEEMRQTAFFVVACLSSGTAFDQADLVELVSLCLFREKRL
jgi:hypothetical protein